MNPYSLYIERRFIMQEKKSLILINPLHFLTIHKKVLISLPEIDRFFSIVNHRIWIMKATKFRREVL